MNKGFKKIILMVLAFAMTVSLCACAGGKDTSSADTIEAPARAATNEINVAIPQDLDDSLDPHMSVAAGTREVNFNIFEGLLKVAPDSNIVPAVAEKWEVSPDGTAYSFTIREGVKFHNGDTVTADDVVFSISRCAGMLDDNYYGDDLTPTLLEFLGETYSVSIDGWLKNRPAFQQAVVDADLITVGIGSNDILMTVWFKALGLLYGENASLGTIATAIGNVAQSTQNPTDMMSAVLQLMNTAFGTTKTVTEVANAMLEAEVDFRTNFKAITDRIYALNPDAEVVVVGLYNGAKEIRVSSDIDVQVGKLGDAAFMAINNYIANLCPNRGHYKYVDVWNITLGAAPSLLGMIQNVGLIGTLMTVDHPSDTGHAEIAAEIRAVLPKVPDKTETTPKPKAERWVKKNPEDGKWYCYMGDDIEWSYTGIAKNEYGWWRIVEGRVDFDANSIYKNEYGWWKCTNGKVTFDENEIYKNEYGWWKCTDSKVTFKENGLFSNRYGTWYVKKSKVDFKFNGKVRQNGKTYTVRGGKVVS